MIMGYIMLHMVTPQHNVDYVAGYNTSPSCSILLRCSVPVVMI